MHRKRKGSWFKFQGARALSTSSNMHLNFGGGCGWREGAGRSALISGASPTVWVGAHFFVCLGPSMHGRTSSDIIFLEWRCDFARTFPRKISGSFAASFSSPTNFTIHHNHNLPQPTTPTTTMTMTMTRP